MSKLNQWEALVGLGPKKGLRFSRKSLSSPLSFLVLLPSYPREDLATLKMMSVALSRDIFSPGGNLFSYSLTWRLNRKKSTQLPPWKLHRKSFLPSLEHRPSHCACECVYWKVRRWRAEWGGSCDSATRNLDQFGRRIFSPEWIMSYGTILDQLDGGLTVGRELELIAKFKDEVLFTKTIAVEVLLDGSRDVAIWLVH